MPNVKEPATVTSKGQLTLPKAVRQAMGVEAGDKVVFELREDGQVVVTRWEAEHEDPAIGALLSLLEQDIRAGRRLHELPDDLARAMLANVSGAPCSHEPIEGEVAL
ncbi:MAG: type II toxin-antitoxin system PrlF family antitoxin [Burkholderiales bacterium]|nr:type II toxin-antitoxin system PrlF family antitoxin [Burkholderiales bacterium]OJX04213.1 MAG: AbrB family transcriptional regulator [Burkholderiales bacterium 70-64]